MDNLLEIRNLTTEFRSDNHTMTAVDGVSFDVRRGKTLGIVGESGSGKSVSSLSIMQLIQIPPGRIASGTATFFEKDGTSVDLLTLPEPAMRKYRGNRISMIFQEPMTSLNPVFTCGAQIIEAIQLHTDLSGRHARKRTLELMNEVQLPRAESMIDQYPHQLSGGQKQRVMIAMAMACNPDLLIADEPTTALDVTVQATILELMKELQRKHQMSMMFITHDLDVIADIADDVIVMYKGKIVEQGTTEAIFSNPKHPYTKGLLACKPRLDRKYRILPTVKDFMEETESGELLEKPIDPATHTSRLTIGDDETAVRLKSLNDSPSLLTVSELSVHFPIKSGVFSRTVGMVRAVDGVSFEVKKGETLGLVGESGCGKTTAGRAILRLVEPTSGSVTFDGQDVCSLNSKELKTLRKDFQIIFQDPYSSLNPRLSVGSAIMEVLSVHNILTTKKERKEYIHYLLEKVKLLPRHFDQYPHEFSGGQRQRICIARALALKPKFMVCDESVSALDVSIQAQVLNLLVSLRDEFDLTYIFISHDLSVVKFISDRIAVMNKGKIEEIGSANEIYRSPKSHYTQGLISAIPKGEFRRAV